MAVFTNFLFPETTGPRAGDGLVYDVQLTNKYHWLLTSVKALYYLDFD